MQIVHSLRRPIVAYPARIVIGLRLVSCDRGLTPDSVVTLDASIAGSVMHLSGSPSFFKVTQQGAARDAASSYVSARLTEGRYILSQYCET